MKNKKEKNKKSRELNIIFFIIPIVAALFIVSTYAWLSKNANISITNFRGKVEVSEGLEISLNAKNWSKQIVLGPEDGQFNITNANTDYGPYVGHRNISPSEMLPVSTLGKIQNATMSDIPMLRGIVTNSIELDNIIAMDENVTDANNAQFPGYFAFDIFLKNISKRTDAEVLQLNYNSSLQITENEKNKTGLQNTARIAFARYGSVLKNGVWTGVSDVTEKNQATILKETGAVIGQGDTPVYMTDIAIWEPNSNDHVKHIVDYNNKITWSASDAKAIFGSEGKTREPFTTTTQMPTYALTSNAIGEEIADIYNWDGTTNSTTLAKQVALQTTKKSDTDYSIKEGVQNLISTSSTETTTNAFTIAPNSIVRLRVYVWLEGQDVDCINYASHGGGITLNLGLVKGLKVGTNN